MDQKRNSSMLRMKLPGETLASALVVYSVVKFYRLLTLLKGVFTYA